MSGQIYGFNQVFDANGNPLPGAKLLTRVPGATTPKATYADATLTVPLSNPVIADSGGRFPQIFADEGQVFDLVLTTATDVTIDSFYNVTALGASGNSILIDFGVDGRFAVIGEGGMPNIEFGDPAGDNVGGDGRIGGWDGTQGDTLELDFASVSFTGAIISPTLGNLVPTVVSRGTATASAQVDIPLPATFPSYILEIRNFVGSLATAQNILARLSFDSGVSFKSAADDYQNATFYNGGSTTSAPAANATSMLVTGGMGGAQALGGTDVKMQIWTGTGRETRSLCNVVGFTAGNNLLSVTGQIGSTTNNKNYGRATTIRLTPSTGTMSFTWVLTGVP